jgi:hypothetical protein
MLKYNTVQSFLFFHILSLFAHRKTSQHPTPHLSYKAADFPHKHQHKTYTYTSSQHKQTAFRTLILRSPLALQIALQPTVKPAFTKAIPKADRNRHKKASTKQCGAPLIVVHNSSAFPDFADAPEVQGSTVHQGDARDDGEGPGGRKGEGVAKIEERGCNGADEDGEFEPGEEGAFGCELDFGFDADGDMDAYACVSGWR